MKAVLNISNQFFTKNKPYTMEDALDKPFRYQVTNDEGYRHYISSEYFKQNFKEVTDDEEGVQDVR